MDWLVSSAIGQTSVLIGISPEWPVKNPAMTMSTLTNEETGVHMKKSYELRVVTKILRGNTDSNTTNLFLGFPLSLCNLFYIFALLRKLKLDLGLIFP
jgi:hypothetical protein